MDYQIGQIGMEPPKLCCFPARPLVCFLAFCGIIKTIFGFSQSPSVAMGIFGVIFILLDVILFIGAYQNNEKYLNISLKIVFIGLGFCALQLLIFPVIAASGAASGMVPHQNSSVIDSFVKYMFSNDEDQKQHFLIGLTAGYVIELAVLIAIGAQLIKYVLVNRLWEYAKATEGYA
uniref:MARVEL domain-containing protein n=1 Tax=Caenorhabditis tropicalis TaxID=1561998 RepID=A0A1I7TEU2_9PELO